MSVTEGTGQVGNTFVEVEVQRLFGEKEQLLLSSPQAVHIDIRMKEKAGCGLAAASLCFSPPLRDSRGHRR
jgi:hypothetical protein